MEVKTKKHSIFFRGIVLVVAFALAVICFPVSGIIALADPTDDPIEANHEFITLGNKNETVKTNITKGEYYTIPNAYIGGVKGLVVGDVKATALSGGVTIDSSSVSVYYGSSKGALVGTTDTTKESEKLAKEGNNLYFKADKAGSYVINYSYTYVDGGQTYTNSYDLVVTSEGTNASINFNNNSVSFIPSVIDMAQVKDERLSKDENDKLILLNIPKPEILDADGEKIDTDEYELTATRPTGSDSGKKVWVRATAGDSSTLTLKQTADKKDFYLLKEDFATQGTYTFIFSYYDNGDFVATTTKSTTVRLASTNTQENYYQKYALRLELTSNFPSSAQTGIESTLPAAIGKTADTTTPANEQVDVFYKVKVRFMAKSSDRSYVDLDATKYADVLDADGYLKDPTKFKPLEDGWYTFIYTIRDFYGNEVSSSESVYEFENIKDNTAPTPILYDASTVERNTDGSLKRDEDGNLSDESYKLATRANPNAVVVYAVGMNDNVSTEATSGIELSRKINTETDEKLVIDGYDDYNIVFNYRRTSTSAEGQAYANLLKNNYLIQKAVDKSGETIDSDASMIEWLHKNHYLIAVDNANVGHIFTLFGGNFKVFKESGEPETKSFADADALKKWLQDTVKDKKGAELKAAEEEIAKLGLAYFNVSETFGQLRAEESTGMGFGQYYVHYIAKDAAGNTRDVSKNLYIGSFDDHDAPTITFSTVLADSYLPTDVITFDAPTADDGSNDRNMLERTAYRYLDKNGNVVPFKDENEADIDVNSLFNITEIFEDADKRDFVVDGKKMSEKYDAYKGAGYKDITDTTKSVYTIDLKEAAETATQLQIIVYAYDDSGNVNLYAETIKIERTNDNVAPQLDQEELIVPEVDEFLQGNEIELPTLKVNDDAVARMNYDVVVKHIGNDNKTYNVSVSDSFGKFDTWNLDGVGQYTVYGGKFVASFKGLYQATISAYDSKNNTVVYFANYDVDGREAYWQTPVMNVTMESGTYELDDNPTIDVTMPSVSYSIPNSITYDRYNEIKTDAAALEDVDFVVLGVDQNGKATNMGWSLENKQGLVLNGNKLTANKIGVYDIKHLVTLKAFNPETYEYVEGGVDVSYDESDTEHENPIYSYDKGGYFKAKTGNTSWKVYAESDNMMKVVGGEVGTVYIERVKDGNSETYKIYDLAMEDITKDASAANYLSEASKIFAGVKCYALESDTYRIEIQDTKGPQLRDYDYAKVMAVADLDKEEGIAIEAIELTKEDRSGIDWSKSKVTVSWRPVGSRNSNQNSTEEFSGQADGVFKKFGAASDGVIRIVYTVYDNNNNYTTQEYTIKVGDNDAPIISTTEDFIKETYQLNDLKNGLKIDLGKITATDKNLPEDYDRKVTLKNSNGDEIDIDSKADNALFYQIDSIGTYTLTVEVEDEIGNKATREFTFEVTSNTQNTTSTYQVVGTVLIVVSVLILAGVIVYFIVSKVKLDKELKK